jgi:hypothetical protein
MNQTVACARLHELLESLPLYGANVESGLLSSGSGIYYFYSRTGTSREPSGHPQGPKGLVRIGISGAPGPACIITITGLSPLTA